jgi:hypothetical protein
MENQANQITDKAQIKGDTKPYQAELEQPCGDLSSLVEETDPYDPFIYRCSGYDTETYEWFEGKSSAKDRRFSIDLENGSMDR